MRSPETATDCPNRSDSAVEAVSRTGSPNAPSPSCVKTYTAFSPGAETTSVPPSNAEAKPYSASAVAVAGASVWLVVSVSQASVYVNVTSPGPASPGE